jgi:hypothetical protein
MEYFLVNGKEKRLIVTDKAEKPLGLALLICFHIVICCVSLVFIAGYKFPIAFSPASIVVARRLGRLQIVPHPAKGVA